MFSRTRTILSALGLAMLAASAAVPALVSAQTAATATATSASTNGTSTAALQQQIDANNQQIVSLNQQIAQYQAKLKEIGADKKTLQAAINALDLQRSKVQAQVTITQRQINTTQLEIQQLGGQISDAQAAITGDTAQLGAYLRSLEKTDNQPLVLRVLEPNGLVKTWDEVNATLKLEGNIQDKVQTLQAQKVALASTKTASEQKQATLTAQQQSLASQQQSLTVTVASKSQLLTETKAQESVYQKLLAAAQAQLASFSAFAQNAGGSKLLANQTNCDAWGCYYNQRDALWGNDPLNGTSFKLASDGCLITAMAMVITHYGYRNVTPVTINSDPDNFASYYPAYLLYTISAGGVTATRKTAAIDATLAGGDPVVVGVNAYGGTHFVVLVSGSKGDYLMRDPYVANGKDISFSDHYTLRSIFSVSKVVVSS